MPNRIRAVRNRVANVVTAPVSLQSLSSYGDLITLGAYITGTPFNYSYEVFDMSAAPNYNSSLSCAEFRDSVMMMMPVSSSLAFPYSDLSPSFTPNTWNTGTSAAYSILPSLSGTFTHVLVWRRPNNDLKSRATNIDGMDPGLYGIQYGGFVVNSSVTPGITSIPILNFFSDRSDRSYTPPNTGFVHPSFALGTVLNNSINASIYSTPEQDTGIPSNNSDFMVTVITRTTATSALQIINYLPAGRGGQYTVFDSVTQGLQVRPDPLFIVNNPNTGHPKPGTLSATTGITNLSSLGFPGLAYGAYSTYGTGFYGLSAVQYNYLSYDFPGLQISVIPAVTGTATPDGRPGANPISINSAVVNQYGITTSNGSVSFTLTAGGWNTTATNYAVRQFGTVWNFTVNSFTNCAGRGIYHDQSTGQLRITVSTSLGGTIRYENMPGGTQTVGSGGLATFNNLAGSWTNSNRGDYALVITHVESNTKVYCYVRCWEENYGNSFVQYGGVNYGSGASWTRDPSNISNNPRSGASTLSFTNLLPLETYQYEVYDNRTSPNYSTSRSLVTITIGSQGGTTTGILPPQNLTFAYQGFGKLIIESVGGIYNSSNAVYGKDIDRTGGTSPTNGILNFYNSDFILRDPGLRYYWDSEYMLLNTAFTQFGVGPTLWWSPTATSQKPKITNYLGLNAGSFTCVALSSNECFNMLTLSFSSGKTWPTWRRFGDNPQGQGRSVWPENAINGSQGNLFNASILSAGTVWNDVSGTFVTPEGVPNPPRGLFLTVPGLRNGINGWNVDTYMANNLGNFLGLSGSWIGTGWPLLDSNFFGGSGNDTINTPNTGKAWPYYWAVQNGAAFNNIDPNWGWPSNTYVLNWFGGTNNRVYSFMSLDDNDATVSSVTGRNTKLVETYSDTSNPAFYRNSVYGYPDRWVVDKAYGKRGIAGENLVVTSIPLPPGKYRFKWIDVRQMRNPLMSFLGGFRQNSYFNSLCCGFYISPLTASSGNLGTGCFLQIGSESYTGGPVYPWWMEGVSDVIAIEGATNPGSTPTKVIYYPPTNMLFANAFNFNDITGTAGPWPLLTWGIKSPSYYPPFVAGTGGLLPGSQYRNFPFISGRFSLSGCFNKDAFVTYQIPTTTVRIGQLFTPPPSDLDLNTGDYTCNALMSTVPYLGVYNATVYDVYTEPFPNRKITLGVTTTAYNPFILGYNTNMVNVAQTILNTNNYGDFGPYLTAANSIQNASCNCPLSADIREILFYNKALTDTERKQLVHYLSKKWELGLNLTTVIGL